MNLWVGLSPEMQQIPEESGGVDMIFISGNRNMRDGRGLGLQTASTVGAAYVLLMREDEIFWGKIGWLMHENEPIRVYYNARIASTILT